MTIPLSTVVDISTAITAGGTIRKNFGLGLILTTDDSIPAGGSGKAGIYANISAVAEVFDATTDPYKAAAAWFGADPRPQSLYIGRWASSDVSSRVAGGLASTTVTDYQSATGTFQINGADITVDTSGDADLTAVAATLQTALQTELSDSALTCVAASGRLTITLSSGGEITVATAAATGNDISDALGLTAAAGAIASLGHDAEGIGDAIAEMLPLMTDGAAVALALDAGCPVSHGSPVQDTRIALAAYAQSGDYLSGVRDTAVAALDPTDVASLAYQIGNGSYSKAECIYTKAGEYPDVAALALLSAQRLDSPASIISQHMKALPGVQTTNITNSQLSALISKRCNVYTEVGGLPSLFGGYTGRAGSWSDATWWLLWLKNKLEIDIHAGIRSARQFNTTQLTDILYNVMNIAVQSGGARPGGSFNAATKDEIRQTTGNHEFDGVATSGYIIWVEQPNVRSEADRSNRVARFKSWLAPADAIHKVLGDVVLSG